MAVKIENQKCSNMMNGSYKNEEIDCIDNDRDLKIMCSQSFIHS